MSLENSIRQKCPELVAAGFDAKALAEMMEERFLGEYDIFFAAVELFLEGHENYLADIESAIAEMDRRKIGAAAHRFKGAAANFHCLKIPETAREMEANSNVWEKDKFQNQFAILKKQVGEFTGELKQLVLSFNKLQQEAA
ncbi:hypothetical protein AZI86_00250 [Bdellovibrio bacteriovorus]|uniref:HPt domain-containing protein n=1 Tax=Bdellovibrio bacteriovorus TaxID=959 RepID=A0A150WME6_BDEBC|nr:Hpt domain-containing protein [Bdellovibrio bacteriovorus]KYG65546.1 hypothetical protein AZI86_00250 [Bdellovibrio bacteriovorus]